MSHETPVAPPLPARRRYRFLMPFWAWVVLVPTAVIALLQSVELTPDPGMANMISLSLGAAATLVLIAWFVLFSGFARPVRMAALAVVLLAATATVALVRFEGFSG